MIEACDGVCSLCNGCQWLEEIRDGEIASRRCNCLKRKMMLSFLGPELARAKHRRSELFLPVVDPETNQTVGDRTLDNLFIKGVWEEASQHIRWAVAGKKHCSPGFTFRMVNDEKLLRVYLGTFAYEKRSRQVRDEIETYNNLSDLISGYSLVIIRLGQLGHKNDAAGNVLQEALNIRASELKPTWLVEGEQYFGEGHHFYKDKVGRYIEENFDIINVGGDVKAAQQVFDFAAETVAMSADATRVSYETQERFHARPNALEDRGKSYRTRSKWRGRSGSGGGLPGL